MMKSDILLCSDLDRTLIPNGPQPESPEARRLLQRLAERPELTLAYVSGRYQALLMQAIEEYDLPEHATKLPAMTCSTRRCNRCRPPATAIVYIWRKAVMLGMNGNYSADVLEGLIHFLPQTRDWLQDASAGKAS